MYLLLECRSCISVKSAHIPIKLTLQPLQQCFYTSNQNKYLCLHTISSD